MTPDYKSNSHTSKNVGGQEPKKEVTRVTTGVTKTKKKSEVSKLANVFLAEDVSNVKNYIVEDVLVPAAKKALYDIVTNGLDMLIYGEVRSKSKEKGSKVSYGGFYERRGGRERDVESSRRRSRSGYDYDEIEFEYRGDAESVLDGMFELLDMYQNVSVMDYYDLAGKTGNYIDGNYGWESLRHSNVRRTRGGYILELPRVVELRK